MAANSCEASLSASTFAACLAVSIFRGRTHSVAATNGEIVRFVSRSTSIVPVGRWGSSCVVRSGPAACRDPVDPLEGFILHDAEHGATISTS